MTAHFSRWSQKRILRWLLENYPSPGNRLVEIRLDAHFAGAVIKLEMVDKYDKCICELAYELWMDRELPCEFLIRFDPQ